MHSSQRIAPPHTHRGVSHRWGYKPVRPPVIVFASLCAAPRPSSPRSKRFRGGGEKAWGSSGYEYRSQSSVVAAPRGVPSFKTLLPRAEREGRLRRSPNGISTVGLEPACTTRVPRSEGLASPRPFGFAEKGTVLTMASRISEEPAAEGSGHINGGSRTRLH